MRTIDFTSRFKKDYKREERGRHARSLDDALHAIVSLLVENLPLPMRLRDHALTGNWIDHRDCHIKPDLVLIYRFPDATSLELVRLGSHSELGL